MKQVSYSGKYSLSASRPHHSHLQFSFVVGDAFPKLELSQRIQRRKEIDCGQEAFLTKKENCKWERWALLAEREYLPL